MTLFEDKKYLVIKMADIEAASAMYGHGFRSAYEDFLDHIRSYREIMGKEFAQRYYVVNQDEPYAEEILNLILKRENEKASANY